MPSIKRGKKGREFESEQDGDTWLEDLKEGKGRWKLNDYNIIIKNLEMRIAGLEESIQMWLLGNLPLALSGKIEQAQGE